MQGWFISKKGNRLENYDDDDLNHGTAGILSLCDLLVAKIDAYLEN